MTGLVLASYGLSSALFQPIFGRATDKIGRRKPFIVYGLTAVAIVSFSFIFVNSFETILTVNILRGIAVGITIPPTMALVAEITEKRTRGGSIGIYTTMRMTGFAIAPLFSGILIVTLGHNSVFISGGLIALLGAVLVQILVTEPNKKKPPTSAKNPKKNPIPKDLYVLGLALFFMMTSVSLMTTLETQFNEMLNQTAVGFSIAFSALLITRIIFQTPIGRFSDKKGRKSFIFIGMIAMGILTFLLPYVRSTMELALVRMGQGLASAGIAAPGFALAADIAGEKKGEEMSILTTSFMLGIAGGPLISGFLASYVSFESPFWVGGILTIIGGILVHQYVRETIKRNANTTNP